ncbi:MAG: polysaccharide biosynthesis/export family protein, partial [Candidatus Marinimicrobia bacterium]|nr:polysaccharide biosynthesis/export family protein [Candidatus Neomarinimicrobiota bacterium]
MINKYKHIVYVLFVSVFALGYGQSTQELQRLRSDYEKFQRDQNQLAMPKGVDQEVEPGTGLPREAQITSYQPMAVDEIMEDEGLKHFGYDFFTRRDEVAFWENLPTPANYLLGSGDELVISLWGETQIREKYTITRDGKIYDGKVGLLTLTGKSMGEARQYLKDQFARVYATLKGKNATTFIDVSLGELRSINVNFVGQIKYPGVYPIHPFSTVITGLIQAGGVDTTGS